MRMDSTLLLSNNPSSPPLSACTLQHNTVLYYTGFWSLNAPTAIEPRGCGAQLTVLLLKTWTRTVCPVQVSHTHSAGLRKAHTHWPCLSVTSVSPQVQAVVHTGPIHVRTQTHTGSGKRIHNSYTNQQMV